jgi:hypothetical protein
LVATLPHSTKEALWARLADLAKDALSEELAKDADVISPLPVNDPVNEPDI